jgi:naphtho-gamma-pyrone polyketide synthase
MNEVVVASAGCTPDVQNSVKTSIQYTLGSVAKSKVSTSTLATSPLASPVSIEKLMQIISEEIGIPVGGLSDTACFADLGVDSLLSLSISSRIRDELVLECHSGIFHTHQTVQELKKYFQNQDHAQVDICQTPLSGSLSASSRPSTIPQENIDEVTPTGSLSTSTSSSPQLSVSSAISSRLPSATSVLLHGNPRTSPIVLFLFPDGSGSATSYTAIPSLGPNTAMIGLNSPFLKDTDTFGNTTIEELTGFYLEEVRRRQPRGPYYLAGWSAGGVCAFAAAKILLSQGSEVAALVAIDSPFPDKLSQFPPYLYKFFSENGIFGPNPAKWLLKHLSAVAIALSKYRATPFPPDNIPKSLLIWCEDGIAKEIGCRPSKEDDEPWEATALLDGKSDLGPNGWDLLLGPNLRIETLPNCNHFSMMKGTSAKRLGEILKTAIC